MIIPRIWHISCWVQVQSLELQEDFLDSYPAVPGNQDCLTRSSENMRKLSMSGLRMPRTFQCLRHL